MYSNEQLFQLERQWVMEAVKWLQFLREEGHDLLTLPIPSDYLVSKKHFFDLIENGGLHLQSLPELPAAANLDQLSNENLAILMECATKAFGNEYNLHQTYLAQLCRERAGAK